jgi:hypothetical protein
MSSLYIPDQQHRLCYIQQYNFQKHKVTYRRLQLNQLKKDLRNFLVARLKPAYLAKENDYGHETRGTTVIETYASALNEGKGSIFKLRKCAQSILRIKLPLKGSFLEQYHRSARGRESPSDPITHEPKIEGEPPHGLRRTYDVVHKN